MPPGMLLRKLIDGEEIWRKWTGFNGDGKPPMSLADIRDEYELTGKVNPATGQPVTRAGLCDSAWRWAMKNITISMPMLIESYQTKGEVLTEEEAKRLFAYRAKHVFQHSSHTYRLFLEKYHLQDFAPQ